MEVTTRIRCINRSHAVLGEGPVWDERSQRLYWVDIESGTVHRCAADGADAVVWRVGQKIGCIALRQNRPGLIGGLQSAVATLTLDPLSIEPIAMPENTGADNRCNDGKCDGVGRFWIGTCDQTGRRASGYLYRVGADHTVAQVAGPFICTNGPEFSPDGRTLYCVDTYGRRILAFNVDEQGALSGERAFIRFVDPAWGYPDGLTCDSIGCLWVAHWGGSRVSRFAADGEFVESIQLPVSQPTSCTFGGVEFKTLFITSASLGLARSEAEAGAVFAVDVDVGGRPAARYGG